jgi:NAD(P)-dependent dehydrogenase (short-subunit alcohol dehydrogenase family)
MSNDQGNLFTLSGQVAAVTGGGGILCSVMAKALAQAGARVAVLDLAGEAAQRVAEEITGAHGQAIAIQTNVLDKASVQQACATIIESFGRVDILVNGAGGNRPQATTSPTLPFFDLPEEAFRQVFDLNLLGTVLPCQVFGRVMASQGYGVIINIASINAWRPLTNVPAYAAAKAAVSNFTQWLAVHMSQNYSPRIRVNAIAPGFFLTAQNRYLLYDETTGALTPRGKTVIDHTPLGRFGDPQELVTTLLWLASPASSFVHGITVAVDGGFTAFSGV